MSTITPNLVQLYKYATNVIQCHFHNSEHFDHNSCILPARNLGCLRQGHILPILASLTGYTESIKMYTYGILCIKNLITMSL